ncbi:MAG: hypothetical protein COU66_02150 [Candidatus Pacebacteria bacterium CG10_big_fil_rev_8_21_14_0_10_44_11]|nr:MAG: hypothetical protein COU66_02150 [Candidatus Pacebacteria bacterium CG10_big_fil_rev_8_21_14_0_10_44_11]
MNNLSSILKNAAGYLLLASIVAAVLLILPISDNLVFNSKYFAFIFITLLLGMVFVAHSLKKGAVEIILSPFTTALTVFGVAILASTFFTNNYPVESLLGFGGIYLAMILYVLFSSTATEQSFAKKIIPTLAISGSVLTILGAAQAMGFGPANLINQMTGLSIPETIAFSLASSPFVALQVIGLALAAVVIEVLMTKKISQFAAITFPILLIGAVLHVWAILPGKPSSIVLPSLEATWSVALDTIRTPRAALIGMGPDSYINMYTKFKPVWVNGTKTWALSFSQGTNLPLTLLATTGFFGLISWLFLVYVTYTLMKRSHTQEGKILATTLFASFVVQFFIPANVVVLILQAVLIVGIILSERSRFGVLKFQALAMSIEKTIGDALPVSHRQTALPVMITSGALLIGIVILGYLSGRAYAASIASFASNKALAENDAVGVYDQQQKAIQLNPWLDVYHRQYANTNLLIATSLAQKTDATDADKEQVSQLLQQAVREAQSATQLDQYDVQNWAVLAQIYQNMVGAVDQADQFAIQAYVQAIQNDPTNPNLRISVGGIFLGQKKYQDALSLFNQAIQIKPDYPNAYYNAGFALKELGGLAEAKQAYEKVLTLIDSNSEDYTTVSKEVQDLTAAIEKQVEATKSAQLNSQGTTPSSLIEQSAQSENKRINTPVEQDVDLSSQPKATTPLGEELNPSTQPTAAPEATTNPEVAP